MSLAGVTIEKMVRNRLPYLSVADDAVVGEFKCEVYHEVGPSMGIAAGDIEDDSKYGGLQKSLISDIVACYMLFTRSIETLTGINGKITNVSFAGAGLNDTTFTGIYTGTVAGVLSIEIDATGAPDTYKWSIDGGPEITGISITGGGQVVVDGVIVTFAATTGHTLGDLWLVTLVPGQAVSGKILTKAKAGSTEAEWEQLKGGGSGNNGATSIKMETGALIKAMKSAAARKARNLGFIIDICEECSVSIEAFNVPPSPPFIIVEG